MILASLHRVHWLLISVAVGLVLGYVLRLTPEDFILYGTSLNSPVQFETALVETIGEDRRFKEITVTRCRIPHGNDVDFVSGLYCNGQVDANDNAFHWKPTFFVAPVPYHPVTESARMDQRANPTVRDLFVALHVPHRYAWWRAYPIAVGLTGSIVLIGLVWPTLITLIVYGRWTRPPEEKGFNLWLVKPSQVLRESPAPTNLAAAEDTSPAPPPGSTLLQPVTAPVQPLAHEPLTPTPASVAATREFGADPDDFYPTEQKAHRH